MLLLLPNDVDAFVMPQLEFATLLLLLFQYTAVQSHNVVTSHFKNLLHVGFAEH